VRDPWALNTVPLSLRRKSINPVGAALWPTTWWRVVMRPWAFTGPATIVQAGDTKGLSRGSRTREFAAEVGHAGQPRRTRGRRLVLANCPCLVSSFSLARGPRARCPETGSIGLLPGRQVGPDGALWLLLRVAESGPWCAFRLPFLLAVVSPMCDLDGEDLLEAIS